MGKKSKRTGRSKVGRREARREARKSPRAEADHFRQEFLTMSENPHMILHPKREEAISRYEEILRDVLQKKKNKNKKSDFLTKEDYDFLKLIYNNKTELPHVKILVIGLYGNISFKCNNKEEGYLAGLVCVSICNDAILGGVQTDLMRINKNALINQINRATAKVQTRYWKFPNTGEEEEENQQQQQIKKPIAQAGVLQCSGCGKLVIGTDDDLLNFLKCCGRCKKSYYCSVRCQASDWKKGGHRFECRKKGEYKVGDTVYCARDPEVEENRWIPCDCKVQLLLPIIMATGKGKKKPQKWLVSDLSRHKHMVVPTKQLHRVRSLKWWNFIDHENKRRVVQAIKPPGSGPGTDTTVHLFYPTNPQREYWLDVRVVMPDPYDTAERYKVDEEGRLMTDRNGGKWRYVVLKEKLSETLQREFEEGGSFDSIYGSSFKKHMKGKYYIGDDIFDDLEKLYQHDDDNDDLNGCDEEVTTEEDLLGHLLGNESTVDCIGYN